MLTWRSAVDYVVLCAAFYVLLRWASRARALRLALSVSALYAGSLIAHDLNLIITAWVLQAAAYIVLALLIVLFQPELRRALLQIDSRLFPRGTSWSGVASVADAVSRAAFSMAERGVGALIVMVRKDSIEELIEDGVPIGAEVTAPLLEAIFQKTSPIHDGAAVISKGRIARANGILPLTQQVHIPGVWGTRHRAGMGLAERSDAVVVVVSEERGEVTLMQRGEWMLMPSPEALTNSLSHAVLTAKRSLGREVADLVLARWQMKLAAAGLASAVWAAAVFLPGNIIRTVRMPVEFTNVPRGLDVASQSATVVEAQLRGRTWEMDSVPLNNLVAKFDLRSVREGVRAIRATTASLDLPPGVTVKSATPEIITVRIVPRKPQ